MKKKLSIITCWFIILGMFLLPFLNEYSYIFEDMQLNPNDYARITDVEYRAVVVDEPDSNGKVHVTERLTFDVHAASPYNLFWELWRDLPEDYIDGVKVDYKVLSVKQILPGGYELIYDNSYKLYWDDFDYVRENSHYGPEKWYHSKGPYNESREQYECLFFYVDGIYREKVVFEIEYEMRNAALRYGDCSDLYLSLYSGSTIKHLNSFKAEILFPNEDMPAQGNYDVYTYGTDANEFPVTESSTANPGYYTFSFALDEEQLQFHPYNEYIEFDLVAHGADKHIFTEYASRNDYYEDDVLDEIYAEQQAYTAAPAMFKSIKTVLFVASIILGIYVLLYAILLDRRMRRKHTFYSPDVDMDIYRDIPGDLDPNFAAALVFCRHKRPKDDSGIYSGILLSLARKNYITLMEESSDDILITIHTQTSSDSSPMNPENFTMGLTTEIPPEPIEPLEPLTHCESLYYNLIVRHAAGDHILMSTLENSLAVDYYNSQIFLRNMKNGIVNVGIQEGYFQKADYNQPQQQTLRTAKYFLIFGVVILTLVNIISRFTRMDLAFGAFFILGSCLILSSILLKMQAKKYVLLTQFGENEYVKWRGLYNFLNSDTLIHERTYVELPIWEKYLVYATAFGISEKIMQAINIRCPEAVTSSPVLSNRCYRSRRFHHSSRSLHSAMRTGYSGGYHSGGFGYGGGGRGGGGGGGGH